MKMFELIPYMLELDYDSEIRIIEDLEHDDGGTTQVNGCSSLYNVEYHNR